MYDCNQLQHSPGVCENLVCQNHCNFVSKPLLVVYLYISKAEAHNMSRTEGVVAGSAHSPTLEVLLFLELL